MGLLRPSFVPPPEVRALRDLTRTRLQLLKDRTREWQRLEKLLEGALIKLSSAVYSMARNKTARDILEAIVAGERDPKALAARAHGNIKGGAAAIGQALEGMLLGEHHPMLIRVHLDHITLLDRLAAEVEDEIEAALDAVPAAWGITADSVRSAEPGPDAAVLPAAERLAESPASASGSPWRSSPKPAWTWPGSRLPITWCPGPGLAPVARQSGPRQRKPSKGQGDAYLKMYCAQAANGAANTSTFLGERLRRLSRPPRRAKAKCAVGRSILVIIWHLLADPAGQVHRPRPRLARRTGQPRPQDPQPPPPAQGPRARRDRHPDRRLTIKPPLTRPPAQGATGR